MKGDFVTEEFRAAYLRDIVRTFQNQKTLGERAMAQVADADLHAMLDADANSIAVIVQHLAGNLRSRFTDFLTSDGEKPDRNRDGEFEMPERTTRAEMLGRWEAGWAIALAGIQALAPEDLMHTVTIRGESFLVVEALNRAASHAAYHVGQIVLLAKHYAGSRFSSLSIPKRQSASYRRGTFKEGIIPTPTPPER